LTNDPSPYVSPHTTIRVGKPETGTKDFIVHQYLICDSSPFFEKTVADIERTGGDSYMVELPDYSVDAFTFYFNWIYDIETLTITARGTELTSASTKAAFNAISERLRDAYLFGLHVEDLDFCDMIIDNLLKLMHKYCMAAVKISHDIFVATAKDSPPRQVLIDIWAYDAVPQWWETDYEEIQSMSPDALSEIVKILVAEKHEILWGYAYHSHRARDQCPPRLKDKCRYHWHTHHGSPCYKAKRYVLSPCLVELY
jgi:hypothetical protein